MRYIEEDLAGKRILITGGAGFIGSNLAAYFQENHPGASVVIFDCFRNSEVADGGNVKTLGHYKNIVWFKGEVITGNTNNARQICSGWPMIILILFFIMLPFLIQPARPGIDASGQYQCF